MPHNHTFIFYAAIAAGICSTTTATRVDCYGCFGTSAEVSGVAYAGAVSTPASLVVASCSSVVAHTPAVCRVYEASFAYTPLVGTPAVKRACQRGICDCSLYLAGVPTELRSCLRYPPLLPTEGWGSSSSQRVVAYEGSVSAYAARGSASTIHSRHAHMPW